MALKLHGPYARLNVIN
jgi:hypothetical protein